MTKIARLLLLPGLAFLLFACTPAPEAPTSEQPPADPDPRTLLESARRAALEARGVRYHFEFGRPEAPSTWATGETRMLQRGGLADGLIRVEGRLRVWDEEPAPFLYSTDGSFTRVIDPVTETANVRAVGAGDRSLGGSAIYGYLTEFVEADPYWKELRRADSLRLLDEETVRGVDCWVLEVLYHPETRHVWYFAKQDLLPRGLRWFDPNTPQGSEFWLSQVLVVDLVPEDFTIEIPAGYQIEEEPEPGPPIPSWSLTDQHGKTVASEDLRGKVVVLDFWNTWCLICRTLQPQMEESAAEYGDRDDVAFYGVNVFELDEADPAAYWTEIGHRYDFLRDGDAVAQLYDVPWQPGVVVLGRDGRVVFSLVGGSGERREQIERAIEKALRG